MEVSKYKYKKFYAHLIVKTNITGAQIIDLMILVIDAQKGIQTQTAECIVIGELLQRKLIVVINKTDLLDAKEKDAVIKKLETKLRKTLSATSFGDKFPLFPVSALNGDGIAQLLEGITSNTFLPQRKTDKPLLMYVDHCFSIKVQGTFTYFSFITLLFQMHIHLLNIIHIYYKSKCILNVYNDS